MILSRVWKFYEWDFRIVDHWYNYGDGNDIINGSNRLLDSILILNGGGEHVADQEIELLIGDITYNPKGKLKQ